MALYYLGSTEIYKELQSCCDSEVSLLTPDTLPTNISEHGVLFLDGEQDFPILDAALQAVEGKSAIKVVVLCAGEPALNFDHTLYLPLKKDIVNTLVNELESSTFNINVNDAPDIKTGQALERVNEIINAVFGDESTSNDFEDDYQSFHKAEESNMSENDKDEQQGLEFNIPDGDATGHSVELSSVVENDNDLEMDVSDGGLTLSEDNSENESFTVEADSSNDLNFEMSEGSSPGIALGGADDNFQYNADMPQDNSDIDFNRKKEATPSPVEEEIEAQASEELEEMKEIEEDFLSEESELDDAMAMDADGLDGLDASMDDDLSNDLDGGFSDDLGDDLSDDLDELSASDDLIDGSDDFNDDLGDNLGEIEEIEFGASEQINAEESISDEFSDVDLLFAGQDEDEEDLAKTKVVSTGSHQIDEDELDKTLNTMLFADNGDNDSSLADMVSDLGKDLDGVEELDFSSVEEINEPTKSITSTDAVLESEIEQERDEDTILEFSEIKTEIAAPPVANSQTQTAFATPQVAREEIVSVSQYAEDELLRLQGTIRQLREEREEFLKEIDSLKSELKLKDQDKTTTDAELDELKIELSILKKRHLSEMEELRYQWRLSEEKKDMYEQRAKNAQKEIDRLASKIHIDINKVKQREKELESQLELVTMDSESKVKSRDMKILELKRKIDALEFNMENVAIREQKLKDDKVKIEERLDKIMKTLRGSIKLLEDDVEYTGEEKEHKE
ncbi:hypothetical protein M899_0477 [Bacteriovorax sp. BSW11_IV]|uniref:hypothetical protein n=1 Tax=Bacteriovorax sp. BSW11_IV TaxID=1353529 RepID=UPI00038A294F|nr:hypothetical protein [Bacteriovorax sp. BSW11_IV]EQC45025.1 hypothetical protein M899_0477 [Bacteriovorax sp. BSW11_IV]